jgi:hypothetical protein
MRIHSPIITGSAENTNIVTTTRITSLTALSSSFASTASFVQNAQSASFAITASHLLGQSPTSSYALTASFVLDAVSSSFAATASSADNLTVRGTLTAQTINVQTITSSIEFNTGSTRNGSTTANTHEFTGSLSVSGSTLLNNIVAGDGTQTPDASGTITIRKGVAFAGLDLMSARTSGNIGGIRFFDSTNAIKSTIVSEVDGSLVFANNNIERLRISPTGSVGIGTAVLTGFSLHVGKNITGGTVTYGIAQTGQVQSDVTNTVYGTLNQLNTQATAFTLSNYHHFTATQGTIGANSVVSLQTGFHVLANLTGATTNYGFRGTIPSGSGRFNLYMDGTAQNYVAGNLGIGSGKTTPTVALDISGSALITGSLRVTQGITGSLQGTASFATSASFALTASYISGSGGGVGFPFSGSAIITGSLFVSGSTISGSFVGDGSGITGLTAGGKIHTQSSAASTWTVSHNLGVQYPNVTVYDDNNNVIIPQTIVATDANTLTLTFGSAVSGYAVAGIGGIINVQGRTTQQYFTASTTWSFAHNLGDKYVSLQAFDDAFEMMIPTTIRLVDFTSSLLLFDSASSGYAVATIGGDLPAISSSYAGYTLQVASSAPYSASWVAVPNVTVTTAVSSSFAATASSADNLTVRSTLTLPTGTTAQRPASPNTGSIRFNTSITAVEYFSGTTWQGVNSYSSSTVYPVELLVVGGGGGGGCGERTNSAGGGAGGGGAGGYIATTAMIITGSSNPIIVGTGGAGSSTTSTTGAAGGDSGAFNFRAVGGGPGMRDENVSGDQTIASGGSGGGAGGDGTAGLPGLGIYGQGNNGNAGFASGRCGGGGGGAQTGSIAYGAANTRTSGPGGSGLTWLNGSAYAGGGGGGAGGLDTATSSGGTGGGGAGSSTDGIPGTNNGGGGTATAGTANTGGGGGGGAAGRAQGGQNGGSGIVIIRYQGAQRGIGGTVSSSNGYTYHTFTTSGTFIG